MAAILSGVDELRVHPLSQEISSLLMGFSILYGYVHITPVCATKNPTDFL